MHLALASVRFGSLVDIVQPPRHVRSFPQSRHSSAACAFCHLVGKVTGHMRLDGANAAGINFAQKQVALRAVLRSDLRVQRACARPFFLCELPRLSPALVSRMAFRRLSGASIHGKGLPVEASFSKPSVPDRHYCHGRKLSERVPFEIE